MCPYKLKFLILSLCFCFQNYFIKWLTIIFIWSLCYFNIFYNFVIFNVNRIILFFFLNITFFGFNNFLLFIWIIVSYTYTFLIRLIFNL